MSRFDDRLDPSTFDNDVEVDFVIVEAGTDWDPSGSRTVEQVAVPERLFARLHQLGAAYELHRLQNLEPEGQNRLNRSQVESLIEEMEFVRSVVDDPALRQYLPPLLQLARRCLRSARPQDLIIEGP